MIFDGFFLAMEKRAVSAGKVLALLQARAAQGARIAPKVMAQAKATAATGATSTPASMRRLALNAGGDVRAATQASTLAKRTGVAPQRQALYNRAQVDASTLRVPGQGKVMSGVISRPGADFMAGRGTLQQAQKGTQEARRFIPSAAPTMQPMASAAAPGATAVGSRASVGVTTTGVRPTAPTVLSRPPAPTPTDMSAVGRSRIPPAITSAPMQSTRPALATAPTQISRRAM